jgi:L-threonylcarbamoyladenylate synthase
MAIMPLKVQRAVQQLQAGGVIAYPTEAVWGFGCDPDNRRAVSQLLVLKRRPVAKGLILVAADSDQFAPYLEGLDSGLRQTFCQPSLHPVTWLVPANEKVAPWVKGSFSSVALRVSTHKPIVDLCLAFGGPIVSTSANLAGKPTLGWPWQFHRYLGRGLDAILPGQLGGFTGPSEIRDLVSGKVIRPVQ